MRARGRLGWRRRVASPYQTIEAPFSGATLRLYVIGYERCHLRGPQTIVEGRGLETSHFEVVADVKTGMILGESQFFPTLALGPIVEYFMVLDGTS